MQHELIPASETGSSMPVVLTPSALLNRAIASGAGIDVLEKLMALQERYEANQARKAFDDAMSSAKAEIPVIFKNRTVDFTSSKGRTHYQHEDLAGIARSVDPILSRHGLSYRYRVTSDQGGITVTCVVSHRDGHNEETTLSSGRDESGNKNHIQAIGSAITYLQRYTLKAALGLSASDDDDGSAAGPGNGNGSGGGSDRVTDEQAERIRTLAIETKASVTKLLEIFKAESITDIRAKDYSVVIQKLEARRAQLVDGVAR